MANLLLRMGYILHQVGVNHWLTQRVFPSNVKYIFTVGICTNLNVNFIMLAHVPVLCFVFRTKP